MSKSRSHLIAITGQIGSGKSSFMKFLAEAYPTISSDEIVAELLEKPGVIEKLKEIFGSEILTMEGSVDKIKLSNLIFNDNQKRLLLEATLHPLVEAKIFEIIPTLNSKYCFIEVPLLFEVNWQDKFDKSVLVFSDETIIRKRLIKRGYDQVMIKQRLSAQLPLLSKLDLADYVIYNNGTLEELKYLTKDFIKRLEKEHHVKDN